MSRSTRPLLRISAVASIVVSLAACGGGNDTSDDRPSAAASAAAGSGGSEDGAFPVTVETEHGVVTIEEAPERIVTLGNPAFENVVAMDETPVAANVTDVEELPYLADLVEGHAIDDDLADIYGGTVNFEGVAAAEPDLIVAPAWPVFTDATTLETLQAIAPTLLFDMQTAGNDWRVGMTQVAAALGDPARGEELIDAAMTEFDRVAEELPNLSTRPYSFGLFHEQQLTLASGGNILRQLGMAPAEDQRTVEDDGSQATFAAETYNQVQGEIVLLMPSPREAAGELEASPFWAGDLSERVVWLSDAHGEAINNAGIIGKTWLPGDLQPLLAPFG